MGGFLRRVALGRRAARRLAVLGAVVVVLAGAGILADALAGGTASPGPARAGAGQPAAGSAVTPGGPAPAPSASSKTVDTSTFRQIILPDLLVVAPKGLTAGQLSRLRAVSGVRSMISFDGAEITAAGRKVSVVGVNPATLRSWVPLKTASDQSLWSDLARGEFVAGSPSGSALGLTPGRSYRLAGASARQVRFGKTAALGLSGVDLVVNQALSARLGLVRQVAGLISAPGANITTLRARVAAILGPGGSIEVLRSQPLPVDPAPTGGQPASYLQLFKDSAAGYCPGLSWTVLAAIGQIESGDGQNMGPSTAGALGPMQFLPSTWKTWGITAFGQSGPPDIMNPYDAVPSAARMLCADGAASGGKALAGAVFDYNHSASYVREVLSLAAEYAADYQ